MNIGYETIGVAALGDGATPGTFQAYNSSLRLRDAKRAHMVTMYVGGRDVAVSAGLRRFGVRSPLMHDAQVGTTMFWSGSVGSLQQILTPPQELVPQDDLVVYGAEATDVGLPDLVSLLIRYEDLGGIAGRFLDEKGLVARVESFYSPQLSLDFVPGALGPGRLINADEDQFKANRDYAVLGFSYASSDAGGEVFDVGLRGVDWGNLRIAQPNLRLNSSTTRHFVDVSRRSGMPAIPVFNASNKDTLIVDGVGASGTITQDVVIHMALLKNGR